MQDWLGLEHVDAHALWALFVAFSATVIQVNFWQGSFLGIGVAHWFDSYVHQKFTMNVAVPSIQQAKLMLRCRCTMTSGTTAVSGMEQHGLGSTAAAPAAAAVQHLQACMLSLAWLTSA